jgi:hypothetical protein
MTILLDDNGKEKSISMKRKKTGMESTSARDYMV